MTQYQIRRDDFAKGRMVEVADEEIGEGEILLKIERFAFTSNNITYAVAGDQIGYWQFFPPVGEETDGWGVLPVWGFADVVASRVDGVPIGDRLFGYFPLASHLKMQPIKVSPTSLIDGSTHRTQLPPAYNRYGRVLADPRYTRATDNERMLFSPLFLTAFCLWDLLQSNEYFGAQQLIILSASSKTAIGLAYALQDDPQAPPTIALTSERNLPLVHQINLYDRSFSYEQLTKIDASKPIAMIDMSGNADVLAKLHRHLGDQMLRCINVGLTHWEDGGRKEGFIAERSQFFFAPSWIGQRLKEWGPAVFEQKTTTFLHETAAKTKSWMRFRELNGLQGLADVYADVCAGRIPADEGLIVKL